MSYSQSIKNQAIELRKTGHSFDEISSALHIPRGTIYTWTSKIELDQKAQERIQQRRQYGIEQTKIHFKNKRATLDQEIRNKITPIISKYPLTPELAQIYCSLLFWAEGSKSLTNISFMNSDPTMIRAFLTLFRTGFPLVETKFRVLLHLHEYHNEPEMITYWSSVTNIPLSQFTKTYLKPHTKIRQHSNYMGCCKIKYYDTRLARVLSAIYNTFAENIGP